MKAIILAAGVGRRLKLDIPKSMIELAGRSIIHRQISALRSTGVERIVVVVGYKQQMLREHLALLGGPITFIENPDYADTNTIYSLYLARGEMNETFIYLNADVFFVPELLERLVRSDAEAALAVHRHVCGAEEVKVIVEAGRVVAIGKSLEPTRCAGEFVGVAKFGEGICADFAEQLVRAVEVENRRDEYFEYAVDALLGRHRVVMVDVTDLSCMEIDFPQDLAAAKAKLAADSQGPTR